MKTRCLLVGLLLGLVAFSRVLEASHAPENSPGPFVRKDADERISPDGRTEVRFVDVENCRRELRFYERSSGRLIWSSPRYNVCTDIFETATGMRAFFSPNSQTAVARHTGVEPDNDPRAKFFFVDLATGTILATYDWLYNHGLAVSFSPDGRFAMVEDNVDKRIDLRGSVVEFLSLESGSRLFQFFYDFVSEGFVTSRVNTDRRTVTGFVGTRSFSFTLPSTPPSISITSPAAGTRVARGSTVTVGVFASDNVLLDQVGLRVTGAGLDVSESRTLTNFKSVNLTFSFTVPQDAPFDATITITATATDGAGFQASATSTVQVERAPPPGISQVQPNSGPLAGGTTVILQGGNFQSGASVTFGGRLATNVTVTSPTSIFATTPAGGAAGSVNVTVTNPDGRSATLTGGFTYISYPAVSVKIVQLDASGFPTIRGFAKVIDAALKPINNLTTSNFTITENAATQNPITIEAQGGGEPVSVALVIDTSGSIDDTELASINQAASTFVDLLKATDRAAVIKFSSSVFVVQGFTTDKAAVKAAIAAPPPQRSQTALYDAIAKATELIASETARRAIVVLTDGQNNSGTETLQGAINKAKAQSAPVYALGLGDNIDANALNQLALGTGGQLFIAPTTAQLQSLFATISGEIETQYKFTYTTSNNAKDGTTRLVVVRVTYLGNSGSDSKSYQAPLVSQPPTAVIQSITPNPAKQGQAVTFQGTGSDPDGTVVAYEWSSNLNGVLSTQASFTSSSLSAGDHTIAFRVKDNDGQWSPPATGSLSIQAGPSLDTQLGPNRHDPENTAVGEPVNVVTGNMYMTVEDLVIPGTGTPLRFTRTYNSQSRDDGPMGFGWIHSFMVNLQQLGSDLVRIRTETGVALYFTKDASGTWVAPLGEHSTLLAGSDKWIWIDKTGRIYYFDGQGRLTSLWGRAVGDPFTTSPLFHRYFVRHDGVGRPNRIDAEVGVSITLSYTPDNRVAQVMDMTGRAVTYFYDGIGNLVRMLDASGAELRYEYADPNDLHNLTRMIDANGRVAIWVYDTQDRVIETSGESGQRRLQLSYDEANRRTTVTDSLGRRTIKEYNENGLITLEIDPIGKVTSFAWDSQLNRTSITDALGRTTSMSYDDRGNLVSITDPQGNITSFEYTSPYSLLTKLTDAQGLVTTYAYDSFGRLVRLTDALGNQTMYEYFGLEEQPKSLVDAKGNRTSYTYDTQYNLRSITDPLGNITAFSYDALGNRTAITDPVGHATRFEYNRLNQVTKVIFPDGSFNSFTYDTVGNRTAIIDPLGQTTRFVYDELNQLAQTIDPLGKTTTYTYDTEGNLLSITDAKGNTTRYIYDALNRVTSVINPLGATTAFFQYDAVGNRTRVRDGVGIVTRYTYDGLNRLTKVEPNVEANSGVAIEFAYDALGRRVSATWPAGYSKTIYTYDVLGRLLAVDGPQANDTITYVYDAVGNRLSMTDPAGRTTRYTYDPANRLTKVTDPTGRTFQYSYDADGNLTQLTYPNLSTAAYTYDANHRLLSLVNRISNGTPFASASYTYDLAGRRTQAVFLDATVTFGYDNANRLVSEARSGTNPYTIGYTYNVVGNRITQIRDGVTTTYEYNQANQLVRQAPLGRLAGSTITVSGLTDPTATVTVNGVQANVESDGRWTATGVPLAPGANTVTVTSTDPAGNVTTQTLPVTLDPGAQVLYRYNNNGDLVERTENGKQMRFNWDALGRLRQITHPEGTLTLFSYDADGRRISEGQPGQSSTTDFLYDGFNVLQEGKVGVDASGNLVPPITNTWGASLGGGIGGLLAQTIPRLTGEDIITYPYFDGSGNMVAWDINGKQVYQRLGYEAFGRSFSLPSLDLRTASAMSAAAIVIPPVEGTVAFPYQFSTKRHLLDLVDFGARWYEPSIGRFISPDPAGFSDGPNLYTYVGNDPVNFIDPVGLAGVPLALTDIRRLAQLGNALEAHRGRARLRVIQRANGRQYVAVSGQRGSFPLAPAAYRLDNAQVAVYLNPATAAKGAAWGWGGGLTALLVTTQDILQQLGAGGSLTDPAFLGHTALDIGEGLAAGAVGAFFGAGATLLSGGNPAVGAVVGVVISKGVSSGLDRLEQWTFNRSSTQ